jgi:hypothetical protein
MRYGAYEPDSEPEAGWAASSRKEVMGKKMTGSYDPIRHEQGNN